MKTWKDNFWIWGQSPNTHHPVYPELPGENKMDPAEGAALLGIPNCCRVVMLDHPAPPFDEDAAKLADFRQVVWSAIGAGGVERNNNDQSDLKEVLRQARLHSNVTGAVLDDFFPSVEQFSQNGKSARHSLASIRSMRDQLHGFPGRRLDLWLVWYSYQLDFNVREYVDLCDVITLWTWKGSELARLDESIRKLLLHAPEKRRLAGCYLWNYGERRAFSAMEMRTQLDVYAKWLRKGWIEGIVFCSNCCMDCGLETVDITRNWIREVGHERLPTPFTDVPAVADSSVPTR